MNKGGLFIRKPFLYQFMFVNYGETIWSIENRYVGWSNIPLTKNGVNFAYDISCKLKQYNLYPNNIFTSGLQRSIDTSLIIKQKLKNIDLPIHSDWTLNDRHYGTFVGAKKEDIETFDNERIIKELKIYENTPPIMIELNVVEYPIYENNYFRQIELVGESYKNVYDRIIPYYSANILPIIMQNKLPLIIGSNDLLKVFIKHVRCLSDEDFNKLDLVDNQIYLITLDNDLKYIRTDQIDI
tara:strand:- start:5215 stop:5934 length:720 start_codon:yes stop_codon:yes gene_type:complete